MKAVFSIVVALAVVSGSYLGWPYVYAFFGGDPPPAVVHLKRLHGRIIYQLAGRATFELLLHETRNLGLDEKQIMDSVFKGSDKNGLPPGDIPVLMVVNKQMNEVRYWELTRNVKTIHLKNQDSKSVELKVVNEEPIRIELWLDSPKSVEVEIELKTPLS